MWRCSRHRSRLCFSGSTRTTTLTLPAAAMRIPTSPATTALPRVMTCLSTARPRLICSTTQPRSICSQVPAQHRYGGIYRLALFLTTGCSNPSPCCQPAEDRRRDLMQPHLPTKAHLCGPTAVIQHKRHTACPTCRKFQPEALRASWHKSHSFAQRLPSLMQLYYTYQFILFLQCWRGRACCCTRPDAARGQPRRHAHCHQRLHGVRGADRPAARPCTKPPSQRVVIGELLFRLVSTYHNGHMHRSKQRPIQGLPPCVALRS